jgi:NAD(P)-dependent dehydrogenase (short-subunit alcohol dehydrogenase family)
MGANRVIVLITGGTQGIGKEIAKAFARQGFSVILNYHSNDLEAHKAVNEIYDETRVHVEAIKADVADESQVNQMINTVLDWFGQIDVLVNNAGINKDAVSWKMSKNDWDTVLATNLTGTFLCTKAVIPYMCEKGFGRIINVSSVVGQTGAFGTCNYAASKAGIIGFTKAIAREVANKGITVNSIALGYIDTGMGLRLPDDLKEKLRQQIPMQRFGTAKEVADTVIFISKASYITGQVIAVNGGYYL